MSLQLVIDILSWISMLGGAFFLVVGGIGLLRLPDLFSRMHAGGITDTLGAALLLFALMLQSGFNLITVKLVMILAFLWVTSPTSCHALARAAVFSGLDPECAGTDTDTRDEGN